MGVVGKNYGNHAMPGWLDGTVGYHIDDGKIFINSPDGKDYDGKDLFFPIHEKVEQFSIECRQIKIIKPKLSLWPITMNTDNPENQSKLEANTCTDTKRWKTCASETR